MKVEFSGSFRKDLERVLNPRTLARFERVLDEMRNARELNEVRNLKRLKGSRSFYRIRVGDYRLGFELIGGSVRFLRCLPRKEIYRQFP